MATDATSEPLHEAYLDPAGYLRSERFHRTVTLTPTSPPSSTSTTEPAQSMTVSYSFTGSPDPSAPVVVWLNGMGGHRMAAVNFDGLFSSRGVRLLAIDRSSSGKTTPCPLKYRVRISYEALLAVLKKEGITDFSLLSHSNGTIYAVYTLLRLQPSSGIRVRSWILSAPWVIPLHSGSTALSAARWVPSALTSRLGSIFLAVNKVYTPMATSASWSAGLSGAMREVSAGFVSPWTGAAVAAGDEDGADEVPPSEAEARRQRARFVELNAKRTPHRRVFGGRYYPKNLFGKAMKIAHGEQMDGIGQEALLCLRAGDGASWDWLDSADADGAVPEVELYERAFDKLRRKWDEEGTGGIPMSVVYGKDDALVPAKGRIFLRLLLVEELGLVQPEQWTEIADAGHDDGLGLECVAGPLLDGVLAVHRQP
ncbi:hypothetical protein JCM10207_009024 [Rhodosporidiobolus poonsookiae]